MEKIDARSLSREAQQQLRNQAIRLKKSGRTYDEIAEIVGVHRSTICEWWKLYKRYGAAGIKLKKRGTKPGERRTLTADQEDELQRMLIDKTPDQLKMRFALWTRKAVQELINHLWSIKMPIRTTLLSRNTESRDSRSALSMSTSAVRPSLGMRARGGCG